MQFIDRKAKYPNRWTLVKEDGTSEVVTLVRNDEPIVEGTPINADTLNTLSDVAGADVARERAESAAAEAKSYQDAAAGSASAAASSESEAKSSVDASAANADKAKKEADRAAAIVSTDKTLSVDGAPADAKAVGDALIDKSDSDHTHLYAGSDTAGGTALSVNGFTFAAQTTDPGEGSELDTGKILVVYEE